MSDRHAGVNVPLFSIRSTASWGIGELVDLAPFSRWLASAGFDRLLILPLCTMQPNQTSPYSAVSTMAIDPLYVGLAEVPDFERAGGIGALSPEAREALAAARGSLAVRHDAVTRAKTEALGLAFETFMVDEWQRLTPRAAALAAYIARERWWLDDYALFQALTRSMSGATWRAWPAFVRDRDPRALEDARRLVAREVLRQQYWQWVAEGQWQAARAEAARHGVAVVGDLPFASGIDSAEVWARAGEFMLDVSVGVPPDAFSPTGQDWGLPLYRWEAIALTDHLWMRQRARRMAALFDAMRVDHVVGLYRTYARPAGGEPFFSPGAEADQLRQGETTLAILEGEGPRVIAEDLGTVPDFVRASLARLGIPGCRVLRWERYWGPPVPPFVDPRGYPVVSAAMTGTHDTEPLAAWWDECSPEERKAVMALPIFRERGFSESNQPWTDQLRDVHLELAYSAASNELFLPIQDLFGWRARINTPGTVEPENWTWCLPWPVDRWDVVPEASERAGFLRGLASTMGRRREHVGPQ